MMISVYVEFNSKPKPQLIAQFEHQDYADILVKAANALYDDGRNFYTESDDEVTEDDQADYRTLSMNSTQIAANDAGVDGRYFK